MVADMSGTPPSTPIPRHGLAAVALSLLVAACGGNSDPAAVDAERATTVAADPTPTASSDGPVSAAASYTIDLGEEISLTVPAGERDDVTATLAAVSDDQVVIELAPDGATFESPVELSWPAPVPGDGQVVVTEVVLERGDGTTESLGVDLDGETMSVAIQHFSKVTVESYFDDFDQVAPTAPVLVGSSSSLQFEIPENSKHPKVDTFRAIFAVVEATGWDYVGINPPSSATEVADVGSLTITCLEPVENERYGAAARIFVENKRFFVLTYGELDCVDVPSECTGADCDDDPCTESSTCDAPEECGPATADQFTVSQFHDTGALPPGFTDLGALSAIVAQPGPGLCEDIRGTALVSDQNGSGTVDAGDQFLFGPQGSMEGGFWNPIDRGGPYFIVLLPDAAGVPDGLLRSPFGTVDMGAAPGELIIDGTPVDVVIASPEDPRPVFYDVDFGDEVMEPRLP